MNRFGFLVILNCILFNAFPVMASLKSDMGDPDQASFKSQAGHGFSLEECLQDRTVLMTNDNIRMRLFGVRPDGDCTFHGLELEREEVVAQLIAEIRTNETFRKKLIMPDIKAAFLLGHLPQSMKTPQMKKIVGDYCRCDEVGHDVRKLPLPRI